MDVDGCEAGTTTAICYHERRQWGNETHTKRAQLRESQEKWKCTLDQIRSKAHLTSELFQLCEPINPLYGKPI